MDDLLFDTFILTGLWTPYGRDFGDISDISKCSIKTDWEWYINRLFTSNQQLDALNQATIEAGKTTPLISVCCSQIIISI
jgi:hypothetical protein